MNTEENSLSFKVKITYINGETQTFEVSGQGWEDIGIASRLFQIQKSDQLVLQLTDNSIQVIPYSSILYLTVDPAPPKLPKNVITGVTLSSAKKD
ncbi:MAG: hypothetical protein F6K23_29385 [Okeania sp. SIO2C9]|uniref:hypothetical protein n=1 Tax=Okeania sp. SIO2C9 TaxID=2607791 RepID=UPI0013BFE033|nr:hypothetical protein [Okeania sp. SIO2C9]NEQ76774.1 hypothetical protein [Okeania sp. SIO2C9]